MEENKESCSIIAFTIVARNYLGQASVLFESIRKQCGEVEFCCFVVDGFDDDSEIPESLRNKVFDCRKLGIPYFEEMAFRYDVVEFSTSLKPYIFNHLFESEKCASAAYFDPDLKLYDNLDWLEEKLALKSIVVTPHLLDIEANGLNRSEKMPAISLSSFLAAGVFNFGFIAIKNDTHGVAFVKWWAELLRDKCFVEVSQSLFVDQKWGDFLPCFFGGQLEVLRDAGANVAYWNLHERNLAEDSRSNYLVNGSRLKFMHFSSIDLADSDGISSNIPKSKNINLVTYPEYKDIYLTYKRELIDAGHQERKSKTPYRFNYFEDGLTINKLHRRIFSRLAAEEDVPHPFSDTGKFYRILKKSKLLEKKIRVGDVKVSDIPNLGRKRKAVEFAFFIMFRLLGSKYYLPLLNEMRRIANLGNNIFLIK